MPRTGRPLSLQSVLVLKRAQAAQAARSHAEAARTAPASASRAPRPAFSFGSIFGPRKRASNDQAEPDVRKRAA